MYSSAACIHTYTTSWNSFTSTRDGPATFLAPAVGADARPQALPALAPDAVMLAHLRSPAFLELALHALVGADARPQALLALASDAVMLAYLRTRAFLARAPRSRGRKAWRYLLTNLVSVVDGMMMTFITQRGEGQGNTKKERQATKSKGRGLEEGARRALMRQDGEEGCGERG